MPRDEGGPVFAEPWQAQAFALAVRLSEQGHFTWKEWAAALSAELLLLHVVGRDRAWLYAYRQYHEAGPWDGDPAWVRFSLATGLHVITAHQRRHLWQAWRVRRAAEAAAA